MGLFKKKEADATPGAPSVDPAFAQHQATLASVGLPTQDGALAPSLTAHSGFVKRATCTQCGAPKRLPSTTAYLYCDYCGALVDYDFRLANAGTNAGITNTVFHRLMAPLQGALNNARATGDRDTYRNLQLHIFRSWLNECPQAVSPRARTDPEFRERMAVYCAECAVTKDLDPRQQPLELQVNAIIASFQRVPQPGGAWLVAGDFWTMAQLWKQQMDLAYDEIERLGVADLDPDEPPSGVARKMEYSTFCQTWLPHLSPDHGAHLLSMYGLTGEYSAVEPVATHGSRCGGCGADVHTVEGARRVVCESCGQRLDVATGAVPCQHCGSPLSFPEGLSQLACPHCRATTHRV